MIMTNRTPSSPVNIIEIEHLAIRAGNAIMTIRDRSFDKEFKSDGSPVTEADLAADAIINEGLMALTPDLPRITEETWEGDENKEEPLSYWCVDPLDGTKGFINGGRDFTVNIALIHAHFPVLGVIYAPASGLLWAGGTDHDGNSICMDAQHCETPLPQLADFTDKSPITVRKAIIDNPVIVATKAHRSPALENWIATLNASSSAAVGSSLNFVRLLKAKQTSTPALALPWNGIRLLAKPSSKLQAVSCLMLKARGFPTVKRAALMAPSLP